MALAMYHFDCLLLHLTRRTSSGGSDASDFEKQMQLEMDAMLYQEIMKP